MPPSSVMISPNSLGLPGTTRLPPRDFSLPIACTDFGPAHSRRRQEGLWHSLFDQLGPQRLRDVLGIETPKRFDCDP